MNYDPYYPLALFDVSVIRSKWAASMISSDSFSSVTKIKDKKGAKWSMHDAKKIVWRTAM